MNFDRNSSRKQRILREIVNHNFTFSDLSKRFENVDSSTGNIYCPFHENHNSPAAKMYYDENRGIWIIHCFGECHRNFTAYDYVNLILCEKYQQYKSPLHFLKDRLPSSTLNSQIELYKKEVIDNSDNFMKAKTDYINSVYAQYEDVTNYIEELYMS